MKNIKLENIDRVFLISDIHLGLKEGNVEWLDNMSDYFNNFFFPLLENSPSSEGNKCVIIAGDLFDNRKHIDLAVMNRAIEIMEKMSSICPVIIDIGNHDIYKKSEIDISSVNMFRHMNNVTIIDDVTILEVSGDKRFLIVPWVGDGKEETKILNAHKTDCDVIVAHTEISGMKYDNNRTIVGAVDITSVKKKIYSGHIHTRQESKKCNYIGAPYAMSRSDIDNQKGIYCLHIGKTIQEHFYPNEYSPKFVKVKYELGMDYELLGSLVRNNYCDIIVRKSQTPDINFVELTDKMTVDFKARHIEYVEVDDITKKTDATVVTEATENNVAEIVEEKVGAYELSDEDKAKLIEMNERYLKEAEKLMI